MQLFWRDVLEKQREGVCAVRGKTMVWHSCRERSVRDKFLGFVLLGHLKAVPRGSCLVVRNLPPFSLDDAVLDEPRERLLQAVRLSTSVPHAWLDEGRLHWVAFPSSEVTRLNNLRKRVALQGAASVSMRGDTPARCEILALLEAPPAAWGVRERHRMLGKTGWKYFYFDADPLLEVVWLEAADVASEAVEQWGGILLPEQ